MLRQGFRVYKWSYRVRIGDVLVVAGFAILIYFTAVKYLLN